jgi:hypothetical protein
MGAIHPSEVGLHNSVLPISVVRPASRRQPSKVAVFIDFLAELLAEGEWKITRSDTSRHFVDGQWL